ncbi:hypothetical protein ACFLTZ_06545, partial [Chloroflexota bacterium]
DIIKGMQTGKTNPLLTQGQLERGDSAGTRLIIDACRPGPWTGRDFPPVNVFSPAYRDKTMKKWSKLFGKV